MSYDAWGQDTPFDFSLKMAYQKAFLGSLRTKVGSTIVPLWPNASTFAPSDAKTEYRNYVNVPDDGFMPPLLAGVFQGNLGIISAQNRADVAANISNLEQLPMDANNQPVVPIYPYIPSLSFVYDDNQNGDSDNDETLSLKSEQASAGLDCVAFVHQALSYSGSNGTYSSPNLTVQPATDPLHGGIYYQKNVITSVPTWRIGPARTLTYTTRLASRSDQNLSKELQFAVPGDLFYYVNAAGDGHVGIVSGAASNSSGAISLIEADFNTWNGIRYGGVINFRTLADVEQLGKNWVVGRVQ